MASDADKIATAVGRVQQQIPKLAKLKLVFGVELTSGGLMGPGKSDRFSVELPGPKVSEGPGDDERLQLSIPRTMFEILAADGQLVDWREAFHYGHLRVQGDSRVKRLLGQAIGDV
jgi:hypothetical protein